MLCHNLLNADHEIIKIRYFSAEIKARAPDPDAPNRQKLYWRALKTIPILEMELGTFLEGEKMMPMANSTPYKFVRVVKTEEKGSDVNLSTRLLLDAFDDSFDCAVVISNDSDLLTPIKVVQSRFHKSVGILNPQKRPCRVLIENVTFYKTIREGVLKRSLFPSELHDSLGTFRKPAIW